MIFLAAPPGREYNNAVMVERVPDHRRIWRRRLIFVIVVAAGVAGSYFRGRHVEPPPTELDAARVALLTGATERPERVGGRVDPAAASRDGRALA